MLASVLLAILAAALFGSASPLSKLILRTISPFQLAGLLYLGAALAVAPRLILKKGLTPVWRIPQRSRRLLIGAIVCGGILGPLALLDGREKNGRGFGRDEELGIGGPAQVLLGQLDFLDPEG